MTDAIAIEELLRQLSPQVLAALLRRNGGFDACEDAVQEALLAAAMRWPTDGVPVNPRAWLITVAGRRLTDEIRGDSARRRRESAIAALSPPEGLLSPAPDLAPEAEQDDTLTLLFLCCHPALSPSSQVALTLRAVGGLTTAQIARAFLVPEATMAQRISRAKGTIKGAGGRFALPPASERPERLSVVLHVLYLIFSEGHVATSGPDLDRPLLAGEAVRLAREIYRLLPQHGEVAGLLALMLLTDARRPARTSDDGSLIPLAEQDRTLWDAAAIQEGRAIIAEALPRARLGPYQLQAAIAAIHDEAPDAGATDWPQIAALYDMLGRIAPNPMVTLNHAVAVAMVNGPQAGLVMLSTLDTDDRMTVHHRLHAVRAHLHEMAGDFESALASYRLAARRTTSLPERHYLEARAARLARREPPPPA